MKNLAEFIQENGQAFREEELILEVTDLLSKIMKDSNISKAELATRIDKSKAFVTQCLSGRQNLTLRTLADLFTALEYQLQVGAVPSNAAKSRSVHRLYPVGAWAFERPCADEKLLIDCAASGSGRSEEELCDVA